MISEPNPFLDIFQEKQNKSKKRLEEYLQKRGYEQIHDLRTSIRRLEAAYFIFPKSSTTKKTDDFVARYKKLFKKNSLIRDSDVIIERLLKNGIQKDSDVIHYLTKRKEKRIKSIFDEVKKLSKLKVTKLKEIDPERISTKYEKKIFSLIDEIQHLIPVVISDESKIAKLHYMRKLVKKLRYVLEIDPKNSYRRFIDNMKSFQERLGQIHDCDVTLDFLKKNSKKFPELNPLIIKEQDFRSQIFKKLAANLSDKK